jgi:hypothetical protein
MPFKLGDINGWHPNVRCTPTALAAITGKTPEEIGGVLQKAAEFYGREIPEQLRADYNINDWLKAIKPLGGDWTCGDNFSERPYAERPTINEWMKSTMGPDLELVFCDDGVSKGHVFATIHNEVVDTYTDGKRIKFDNTPASYGAFRVKRTFLVFAA